MMRPIREICLDYLRRYAEKDIGAMNELFADDIVLRDWKIRVEGKEKAMQETQKNFKAAETIEINVLATYENEDTVAAELKIVVDGTEELYVVDVIRFNAEAKIQAIRAYKGRGDS